MVSSNPTAALVEFAFASRVESHLPAAALARLERQCWAHNMRAGLTGELRHANGTIEQVIEGPWCEVVALASRILTDARHGSIAIRSMRPIESRRFTGWSSHGLGIADADVTIDPVPDNVHRLSATQAATPPVPRNLTQQPEQAQRSR